MKYWFGICCLALSVLGGSPAVGEEAEAGSPVSSGVPMDEVPDLRDDESKLTVQKGDFVAVPIPLSSPTFGTGLILGAAYFYAQTPEQKKSQPASFTGAAGAYTTNDSWAVGVGQESYWGGDKWRFSGAAGYVDFQFELRDPETSGESEIDWDITRDVPTNAYEGRRLEGKAIFSVADGIDTNSYQGYYLRLRSYHQLQKAPVVIAWDVNGCAKSGRFPLWDTCRINLRGFPLTDYLGKQSISGQIEARWRASERWGLVAFVGAGHISDSFSAAGDNEQVPSYGAGVRFMVLKSKRVKLRVDYARSDDSEA